MWRLGAYKLDPTAFSLELEGEALPLQRRPFDLLLYLVARRDRVVSREELLREVWGGVAVVDGAVSTAVYELRAALGDMDRARDERWIETVRGRGFRFRGPAKQIEVAPSPRDELPFVGRGRALALLRERVHDASSGRGGALLVEGRAGMGKTRLLQELEATLAGASMHTVQCEEGAPPLWPWVELLGRLPDADASVTSLLEAPADERKSGGGAGLHFERVDAIAGLLSRASTRDPLVIALEDLHWADPASLSLLESLAPRLGSQRVLLIATERSDVDEGPEGLASLQVEKLRLEPLSATQLYPLVEAILGRMPSPELVGWVQRHSLGVPLMVRELAERVDVEGESLVDVPRIAQRVFARRFETLDESCRSALGVAALCGLRFDAPLVEAAAGEALASDRAWIRDGLRAGILVAVQDHPLRFAFRHSLLRDAAEGLLEPAGIPGWHGRIVAALERQRPGHPSGSALAQLARHSAAAAVESPDVEGPLRYALMAARRAARVLDWSEVAVHASHVLAWIEFRPACEERDAQEVEAVLLRCAAIAFASGHVEETEALLERIAPLLDRGRDERARACAEAFRLAIARCTGDPDRALAAVDRVAGTQGLAEVASCWRVGMASVAGDFTAATADASWGDELPTDPGFHEFARRCGRDPGIDRLGLSAFAFWARGADRLAVQRSERAVAWAEASGDSRGRIWALFLLCFLHELRRDWAALRYWAPHIDQASARSDVSSWLGLGTGLRLWSEAREGGKRSPAMRQLASILFDRAHSTNTSLKSPLFLLSCRVFSWAGDGERAERAARDGIAWSERSREHFVLAELHRTLGATLAHSGDAVEAEAARRRAVEVAALQGHVVSEIRAIGDLADDGAVQAQDLVRLRELRGAGSETLAPREVEIADRALRGLGRG